MHGRPGDHSNSNDIRALEGKLWAWLMDKYEKWLDTYYPEQFILGPADPHVVQANMIFGRTREYSEEDMILDEIAREKYERQMIAASIQSKSDSDF